MRKTENIINRTGINKTECKKTGHSKENKIPGVKCTPKIELYLSNFKGALHWWNGSLFFLIIILGITLGIFAGCKNIFVPELPATPEAAGPGGGITVSLRLFTGSARSVMPGMEALIWEITASQGDITISVANGEYPCFSLSLPVSGTWTFTVRGKNSNNDEIFTGSAEQNIESGSTTSISIPLTPGSGMTEGTGATGNLDLTIKPEDVLTMTLKYRVDGGDWYDFITSAGWDPEQGTYWTPYSISGTYPVGQHILDLYFGGGSKFYFCTVAVNIWPGMTSDQWIETNDEEYIDNGEFVITEEMVDEFVKTMGSVVYVDANVGADAPATGSFFAPVNSVSTAVEILRKANPDGNYSGTIMVSRATTIEDEIKVNPGEKLTVKGMGENASITNDKGRVFNIASGGSLTLEENITLTGTVTDDNGGAVYVNGGTFTMEAGSKITGSSATSSSTVNGYGGAVYVNGGTFIMEGNSIITGSSASFGGGVYIAGGTFTMNGTATIQDNTASTHGGGVHILSGGTFTMNGGTIGETAANTATYGGGVFVSGGTFNMYGGAITGNTVTESGGGVFVQDGTFKMEGSAVIQGNKATSTDSHACGGGVYVNGGNFTMSGEATIQGNNASTTDTNSAAGGGGVYVNGGTFTMTGTAKIQGNTTTSADSLTKPSGGGGVFVIAGGTFTMSGGTIGGTEANSANNADLGSGVYVGVNVEKGTFTMSGGTITGNTATQNGGGVYVDTDCAFTMKGGSIEGNTVKNSATSHGGGVFVYGTFTMENGIITNNSSEQGNGGGVNIGSNGTFTMNGGTISANNAGMTGGGVNLGAFGAIMTLEDGTISGNTATMNGGGVGVSTGDFTMSGGTISGNTATSGNGGGVYVHGTNSNFTMTGGTIGGTEPNTADLGGGVYVSETGAFTLGSLSAESSPVISGNTKTASSHNNVYLDNTYLVIGGKLAEASGNVGITMATPGEEFTYGWDSSGSTEPTFFFSDDTKRTVALSGSELSLNLVRVKGGSCTLNGQNVTLSSFWISPYEVTQEEFKSIMTGNANDIASNPSYFQGEGQPPADGEEQKRRPVDRVRWYEAIVYCNLLSIKEGLTPCYTINGSTAPADWTERPDSDVHDNYNVWNSVTCNFDDDGYRLPTEAEWEYAARGGKTGITDGTWDNIYSGSDTINEVAWYTGNSDSKTHEVGKKQDNALGLYDMSGNVREWCWNRKSDNYPGSGENPTGPGEDTSGGSRQLRGGSYNTDIDKSKISSRDSNLPTSQGSNYGFRVVRTIR